MAKRKRLLSVIAVLLWASSARADRKVGTTLAVEADLLGYSGFVGAVSSASFRLDGSNGGFAYATATITSAAGFELMPGLWGGGPSFRGKGAQTTLTFGSPLRPGRLVIPPFALPQDYLVFLGTSPLSAPLHVSPAVVQDAIDNLARTGTRYTHPLNDELWEIYLLDDAGQPTAGRLSIPATLTLPFLDNDDDGIVDGTSPPVRAQGLSLWWLDDQHSLWVKVPGSVVDRAAKTVTAPILHFSVYAVMGAPFVPGDSFAFPTPWRPNGPGAGAGAGQTGTAAGLTFSNLPSEAKIRIYTLSGSLLKEIDHTSGLPQESWDGKSDDGQDAATGTYIWVIDAAGAKKTGKLTIIR